MRKYILMLFAAAALLMTSCGTASRTRASLYPKMYEEKPASILVMPPINNSTNVEAKDLLYTSISKPLAEAGYYVIAPHIAMELFKAESAYDAEMFIDRDLSKFAQVFGADAVIFTTIEEWRKVGVGIQTKISYMIKSTHTNEVLFDRRCDFFLDLSDNRKTENWVDALTSIAVTLINTAFTDHIVAARMCNEYVFRDLPQGKYRSEYQQDGDTPADPKDVKRTLKKY